MTESFVDAACSFVAAEKKAAGSIEPAVTSVHQLSTSYGSSSKKIVVFICHCPREVKK
jgi:hypothetical protein